MKKLLFLISALFLMISCAPKFYSFSYVNDYRQFTKDGFFITESNSVSFKYQPIGSVASTIVSGVSKEKRSNSSTVSTKFASANPDAAITLLVNKCKSLGANGLINLRIKSFVLNKQLAYEAAGMAINLAQ